MAVYAVSQIFAGVFVDRFGGMRVILCSGAVFCAGACLLPSGESWLWIFLCRILLGIGAGGVYLSMVAVARDAFPRNFPIVLGIALMIGYAGQMTALGPFIFFAGQFGWHKTMMAAGGVLTVIYILLVPAGTGSKKTAAIKGCAPIPYARIAGRPDNLQMFVSSGITFAIFMCLYNTFGTKFLQDFCGMASVHAGMVLTVLGALAAVANLSASILLKLCGGRCKPFLVSMGMGAFLPLGVLILMLLTDYRSWLATAAMFGVLTVAANITPVYVAFLSKTNPENSFGTALSFSNFLSYLFVSAAGLISGLLLNTFAPGNINNVTVYGRNSWLLLFSVLAVISLVPVYCTLKVKENSR